MARQVGKDFASGFEGVADCAQAEAEGRKIDWLIAAPSERQSLEALQKWKEWAEVFDMSIADGHVERESGGESLLKSASIIFPHGSRVFAVPGKPETVRGFSANVLLTEFAFFERPEAIWKAILPSVINTKRGLKKVRLITTPNGIGNKAHDIWIKNYRTEEESRRKKEEIESGKNGSELPPSASWSCHFVDIHTASEGLEVKVEEIRAAFDDPEGWAQEFECQFLDVQATLLPYEMIAGCESLEATAMVPPEFWQGAPHSPLVMGIDFGRRHDLTVAWTLKQLGDVQQTVEVLEMNRTPTPEQVERLRPRLRKVRRVCLDYTGAGVGLGDYLVKEFGEYDPAQHKSGKIELCHFSNTLKLEIFSKLRMAFEKRSLRVPIKRVIREDLHSVNRVSTPAGQITYRAPHSADGHADRCTALALALRAAGEGQVTVSIESWPRHGRSDWPWKDIRKPLTPGGHPLYPWVL
jgi:phage FluMu gp28-like protein